MGTIEIQNKVSEDKIKMAIDVLKALGINAIFRESETKMNKEDYIKKVERARESPSKRVSAAEQSKMLGL